MKFAVEHLGRAYSSLRDSGDAFSNFNCDTFLHKRASNMLRKPLSKILHMMKTVRPAFECSLASDNLKLDIR
jgi:hypothetical protein